jgi:hypothetical protein
MERKTTLMETVYQNSSQLAPDLPSNPEPIQPPSLIPGALAPLDSPKEILKQRKAVAKVVKQFVRDNPSMRLLVEGKKYPYIPVWQFCAACFGVTAMVTSTQELLTDDRLEMGFWAAAHAIDRTGRVISGAEATCMCGETEWAGRPSFQLRSMASTRACSKVLSNLFRDVMVMAGLCPTPAEEMDKTQQPKRELTTPCYECGNKVTKKRSLETRRKFGKELCLACEKKMKAEQGEKLMEPITDPKFVEQSIAKVQARKANGGAQPIVKAMDAGEEEIA